MGRVGTRGRNLPCIKTNYSIYTEMAEKKSVTKEKTKEAPVAPAKVVSDLATVEPRVATAVYKNSSITPQKGRLIANMIRGKAAAEALSILDLTNKKGAKIMKKVLMSAMANAENSGEMDKNALVVTRILVDDGIKLRRYRAVARGSAHGFVRRRAHILVELTEKK